ncbi:MAG: M48 family metallopeptidase [Betaproteobacteria bacterium]|nr:M48 family metallopeptidase [Betaproteobacteria bacterium]
MRLRVFLVLLLLALPRALAQGLPDLGEAAQAGFSPLQERRLGESIMREIRADPSYYDDPEATDYINSLGRRLVANSSDSRQDFDFFLIRDNQINAFALPGGFIGINSGLVLAAQSESELASVLAHEVAHVTQRHIARLLAQQKQSQVTSIATLVAAILLSRVSSQAAEAAAAFGQAAVIQSQLNFTRDNEREADRVGLQILERAGYDPRAMAGIFERMQRATRAYDTGAPAYLRTHPLTFERIADMQSRTEALPYRQVPDSLEFQLIRAKLRALFDPLHEAIAFFESSLAERKFLSEAASRYGLATSLSRAKNHTRARVEFAALRKHVPPNALVESLGCRIASGAGDTKGALGCYREALRTYPTHRALTYDYADALLRGKQPDAARRLVEERLQSVSDDHRLYLLLARAYAELNQRFAQHRAQAEAYVRMGRLPAAVEQLQIAIKSGDGDFYQLSGAEARLRELRRAEEELRREARR